MQIDDTVDFGAGDVFTAPADDVFLARDKPVVAFAVAFDQVTREEPTVTKGRRGLFRVLVVALHQRRDLHRQFTGLALGHIVAFIVENAHLRPGHFRIGMHTEFAHAGDFVRALERIAKGAGDFRHAETLDHGWHLEFFFEDVHRFLRERCAVDHAQLVFGHEFVARAAREDGGDRHDDVDLGRTRVGGGAPEGRGGKARHDDQRGAGGHCAGHRVEQRIDVKHRQDAQHAVVGLGFNACDVALAREHKVFLCVHHALRKAGGARGVNDGEGVVGGRVVGQFRRTRVLD